MLFRSNHNRKSKEILILEFRIPGYNSWIVNLIGHTHTSVSHTKSHTDEMSLGSLVNSEADHYVSQAQNTVHMLLIAPIPTFYMEDFTFYCDSNRWIVSYPYICGLLYGKADRKVTLVRAASLHDHMDL